MRTYKAPVSPLSSFGSRFLGDTLFGQICWAIRNRAGEQRLGELLEGYTTDQPFAVVSDAFPGGHLPRPALPGHWFTNVDRADRKLVKKRVWLPVERFNEPVSEWIKYCASAAALGCGASERERPHPHNVIDRRTGTTGTQFAPYTMNRRWYCDGSRLDVYVVVNESRLSPDELQGAFTDIGQLGFGRDASIGLGRYRLDDFQEIELPSQTGANAWMTLSPTIPQGEAWDASRCFYTPFTRFGRHGDIAVRFGQPFKSPVMLTGAGAVLTPARFEPRPFVGRGVGGDGSLSKAMPQTVHQGYAPVVGICLPSAAEAA